MELPVIASRISVFGQVDLSGDCLIDPSIDSGMSVQNAIKLTVHAKLIRRRRKADSFVHLRQGIL